MPEAAAGQPVETLRVPCRTCKTDTKHLVVKSVETTQTDEDSGVTWWSIYQIVQCLGCECLSFRSVTGDSEQFDSETNEPYETIDFYPTRFGGRALLEDVHLLPDQLERVYKETVNALNGKQPVLCGIGVRAVIETVVKDQKATGKDLSKQIDNLVTAGVLTTEGSKILHKLRVLGNKAAHEVKAHSPKELSLAMDVIDHLLQAVYILPAHAKKTFK